MTANNSSNSYIRRSNIRMFGKLLIIIVCMFAFGYALVPAYNAICQATGINILSLSEQQNKNSIWSSKLKIAKKNTQIDLERSITVELDANAHGSWKFKPSARHLIVHPGELTQAMYEFQNTQQYSTTVQAIPSYAPRNAAKYLKKIECFCFNQYTFGAGETKQLPVLFVIDPKIAPDIHTITLSYTFFEVPNSRIN